MSSTLNRLLDQYGKGGGKSGRPVAMSSSVNVHGHARLKSSTAQPVIAVLPFENRSGDPEQLAFSDGISEEILSGLSRQKGLRTIARSSSWQFREQSLDARAIGEKLNATHILEGSVRKAGDRIRVSVQLVETADASPLWSEQYERKLVDVFDVQDDIKGEILAALKLQFQPALGAEQTTPQAYEAYLSARLHYNMLDFDTAMEFAENAIQHDPKYAPAYIMIAVMRIMKVFFWFDSLEHAHPTIKYYNKLARSLDRTALIPQCIELMLQFYVEHKYEASLNGVLSLRKENPDNNDVLFATFSMNTALQRFDKSVAVLDQLLEPDPLSPMYHRFRAEILTLAGRYDEARETLDHTARLGAPDPMQYGYLAFMQGDIDGLKLQAEPLEANLGPQHLYTIITKARILFLEEDHKRTEELLIPLVEMARAGKFHYLEALCAQLCNDKEQFLDKLDYALRIGEFPAYQNYTLGGIWKDRWGDVLAGDRYQSILTSVGLDDASLARLSIMNH